AGGSTILASIPPTSACADDFSHVCRRLRTLTLLISYVGWIPLPILLAGLTLSQVVQAWHVQLIAVGFGIVDALSYPARQAFITEMVGPAQLRNAISITSSVIYLAGLVGPAIGGLLISTVGLGWSFLVTAACYTVPLVALTRIRTAELHALPLAPAERGQLRAGLRYAVSRPDVLWPTILVGLFAMFTGNLTVTLAVYAKSVYHSGAGGYGQLTAIVAVGSLIGALIAGRLHRTRLRTLMLFAAALSALYVVAAVAPSRLIFCALLAGIGAATLLLQTSANSTVQLAAHDSIRGRIVGIYVLVYLGSIAIGGPLLGIIVQHFGPRAGMLLAGTLPGTATLLIAAILLAMRLQRGRTRPDRALV
ncbi:MFS transporter, partial [Kribbella sp. NPDC050820]|uniref:MFS transporter n=1 Tax=Kribbella sp. NPDC050820 TaxID=3155408 RepID=UPI00340BA10D